MFEINDERLGRLKIFNVTEARANFADVLKEPNAKVVVTRHGRPTKILLSYEEFLSLLTASSIELHPSLLETKVSATKHIPLQEEEPTKDIAVSPPPRWVQRDAAQIVSSLKGLFNK